MPFTTWLQAHSAMVPSLKSILVRPLLSFKVVCVCVGVWGVSLWIVRMISKTIQGSQIKFCTAQFVPVKAHQDTKRNFQKSDLWCHNDINTKKIGKIRTSAKPYK